MYGNSPPVFPTAPMFQRPPVTPRPSHAYPSIQYCNYPPYPHTSHNTQPSPSSCISKPSSYPLAPPPIPNPNSCHTYPTPWQTPGATQQHYVRSPLFDDSRLNIAKSVNVSTLYDPSKLPPSRQFVGYSQSRRSSSPHLIPPCFPSPRFSSSHGMYNLTNVSKLSNIQKSNVADNINNLIKQSQSKPKMITGVGTKNNTSDKDREKWPPEPSNLDLPIYRLFAEVVGHHGPVYITDRVMQDRYDSLDPQAQNRIRVLGGLYTFLCRVPYFKLECGQFIAGSALPLPLTHLPEVEVKGADNNVSSLLARNHLYSEFAKTLHKHGPLELTDSAFMNHILRMSPTDRSLVKQYGSLAEFLRSSDMFEINDDKISLNASLTFLPTPEETSSFGATYKNTPSLNAKSASFRPCQLSSRVSYIVDTAGGISMMGGTDAGDGRGIDVSDKDRALSDTEVADKARHLSCRGIENSDRIRGLEANLSTVAVDDVKELSYSSFKCINDETSNCSKGDHEQVTKDNVGNVSKGDDKIVLDVTKENVSNFLKGDDEIVLDVTKEYVSNVSKGDDKAVFDAYKLAEIFFQGENATECDIRASNIDDDCIRNPGDDTSWLVDDGQVVIDLAQDESLKVTEHDHVSDNSGLSDSVLVEGFDQIKSTTPDGHVESSEAVCVFDAEDETKMGVVSTKPGSENARNDEEMKGASDETIKCDGRNEVCEKAPTSAVIDVMIESDSTANIPSTKECELTTVDDSSRSVGSDDVSTRLNELIVDSKRSDTEAIDFKIGSEKKEGSDFLKLTEELLSKPKIVDMMCGSKWGQCFSRESIPDGSSDAQLAETELLNKSADAPQGKATSKRRHRRKASSRQSRDSAKESMDPGEEVGASAGVEPLITSDGKPRAKKSPDRVLVSKRRVSKKNDVGEETLRPLRSKKSSLRHMRHKIDYTWESKISATINKSTSDVATKSKTDMVSDVVLNDRRRRPVRAFLLDCEAEATLTGPSCADSNKQLSSERVSYTFAGDQPIRVSRGTEMDGTISAYAEITDKLAKLERDINDAFDGNHRSDAADRASEVFVFGARADSDNEQQVGASSASLDRDAIHTDAVSSAFSIPYDSTTTSHPPMVDCRLQRTQWAEDAVLVLEHSLSLCQQQMQVSRQLLVPSLFTSLEGHSFESSQMIKDLDSRQIKLCKSLVCKQKLLRRGVDLASLIRPETLQLLRQNNFDPYPLKSQARPEFVPDSGDDEQCNKIRSVVTKMQTKCPKPKKPNGVLARQRRNRQTRTQRFNIAAVNVNIDAKPVSDRSSSDQSGRSSADILGQMSYDGILGENFRFSEIHRSGSSFESGDVCRDSGCGIAGGIEDPGEDLCVVAVDGSGDKIFGDSVNSCWEDEQAGLSQDEGDIARSFTGEKYDDLGNIVRKNDVIDVKIPDACDVIVDNENTIRTNATDDKEMVDDTIDVVSDSKHKLTEISVVEPDAPCMTSTPTIGIKHCASSILGATGEIGPCDRRGNIVGVDEVIVKPRDVEVQSAYEECERVDGLVSAENSAFRSDDKDDVNNDGGFVSSGSLNVESAELETIGYVRSSQCTKDENNVGSGGSPKRYGTEEGNDTDDRDETAENKYSINNPVEISHRYVINNEDCTPVDAVINGQDEQSVEENVNAGVDDRFIKTISKSLTAGSEQSDVGINGCGSQVERKSSRVSVEYAVEPIAVTINNEVVYESKLNASEVQDSEFGLSSICNRPQAQLDEQTAPSSIAEMSKGPNEIALENIIRKKILTSRPYLVDQPEVLAAMIEKQTQLLMRYKQAKTAENKAHQITSSADSEAITIPLRNKPDVDVPNDVAQIETQPTPVEAGFHPPNTLSSSNIPPQKSRQNLPSDVYDLTKVKSSGLTDVSSSDMDVSYASLNSEDLSSDSPSQVPSFHVTDANHQSGTIHSSRILNQPLPANFHESLSNFSVEPDVSDVKLTNMNRQFIGGTFLSTFGECPSTGNIPQASQAELAFIPVEQPTLRRPFSNQNPTLNRSNTFPPNFNHPSNQNFVSGDMRPPQGQARSNFTPPFSGNFHDRILNQNPFAPNQNHTLDRGFRYTSIPCQNPGNRNHVQNQNIRMFNPFLPQHDLDMSRMFTNPNMPMPDPRNFNVPHQFMFMQPPLRPPPGLSQLTCNRLSGFSPNISATIAYPSSGSFQPADILMPTTVKSPASEPNDCCTGQEFSHAPSDTSSPPTSDIAANDPSPPHDNPENVLNKRKRSITNKHRDDIKFAINPAEYNDSAQNKENQLDEISMKENPLPRKQTSQHVPSFPSRFANDNHTKPVASAKTRALNAATSIDEKPTFSVNSLAPISVRDDGPATPNEDPAFRTAGAEPWQVISRKKRKDQPEIPATKKPRKKVVEHRTSEQEYYSARLKKLTSVSTNVTSTRPKNIARNVATARSQSQSSLSVSVKSSPATMSLSVVKPITSHMTSLSYRIPEPSRAAIGNFEKLITELLSMYRHLNRPQIIEMVSRIRDKRGSLTGLSFERIVEETRSLVEKEPARYSSQGRESSSLGYSGVMWDDECSICYDSLSDPGEKVTTLDCKHAFHDKCIKKWVNVQERSCPICRRLILFRDEFPSLK